MNWTKTRERWSKADNTNHSLRLIGYWDDLAGYYADDKTGEVWSFGVTRQWINQGPIAQFYQRIADKKIKGELL